MPFAATVSPFRLEKYEVTVGRFRAFVEASVAGWSPAAGAGKHVHLRGGQGLTVGSSGSETGWDLTWSTQLPRTKGDWNSKLSCSPGTERQTWTSEVGAFESRPINCVSWFEAYAFCIWDGAFLPSEAEWNFAASGGNQQRYFPWSVPSSATGAYSSQVVWGTESPENVGSKPLGAGRWLQLDLAGNVWEWALDGFREYSAQCKDCLSPVPANRAVIRGGSFDSTTVERLRASERGNADIGGRHFGIGFRCARTP
jgi:formylglycine-generating enzyme required for sulfatase activity